MKRTLFLALLLSLAMLVSACGSANTPETGGGANGEEEASGSGNSAYEREVEGGTYARISPEELSGMKDDKDVLLVNTHIPFEGDIPGTDLSIPYDEVGANLEKLPEGEDTRVVLYCMTGPMSTEAAEVLVGRGYENVLELDGGMEAWRDAGFSLEGL